MIRHFNYTDRADLKPNMFRIVVHEGPPRTMDIKWELAGQPLPSDARVYVEATSAGSPIVLRFPFGTVTSPQPPELGTDLSDLPGSPRFTVKIVDETDPSAIGRLVGLAENIQPVGQANDPSGGRESILPVQPVEMGERIWRLRFENDWVYLQVNKNIPGILGLVQEDERFFALVFPEIIRQILTQAMIRDLHHQISNDDGWRDQWLRFAVLWHSDQQPPDPILSDPLSDDDRDQLEQWIEEVVHSFCLKKATAQLLIEVDEEENA